MIPALVPDLTYDGLVISDGGLAMQAYLELQKLKDPERASDIREDLCVYCKMDTFAMVRILEELEPLFSIAGLRTG